MPPETAALMSTLADGHRRGRAPQHTASWIERHSTIASAPTIAGLAVAIACWYLISERRIAGDWGFSLDDSWIYATFARNLATDGGFSFNAGHPTAGATGPLYVFLLAALYGVFHAVVIPAKVLGVVCLAASGIVVDRTVGAILPHRPILGLLAGLLTVISPVLVWGALSGLELPVYLLVACAGMLAYVRGRYATAVALWSVGVWLRPDGIVLALVGVFIRPNLTWRNTAKLGLIAAAPLAALFAFDYWIGRTLFPSSVAVKATLGGDFLAREWSMLTQWLWMWGVSLRMGHVGPHAALLLPAMATGGWLFARRYPALVAYPVMFPIAFGLVGPSGGQHGRYIAYGIPFSIVLASLGVDWFSRRAFGRHARAATTAILLLGIAWGLNLNRYMAPTHGWDVQNINGMQRYLGEAASRAASPGDTIAVNDIGAIGYFSNCYVVDLVGLVSPRLTFAENLSRYHPKYLILFPEWYQQYAAADPRSGQTVFYSGDSAYKYVPFLGVRLQRNVISSRNTMYVFERRPLTDPANNPVKLIDH